MIPLHIILKRPAIHNISHVKCRRSCQLHEIQLCIKIIREKRNKWMKEKKFTEQNIIKLIKLGGGFFYLHIVSIYLLL